MARHIHASLIHQWAEGASIRFFKAVEMPAVVISWHPEMHYRVDTRMPKRDRLAHADVIHQWAEGAKIERSPNGLTDWVPDDNPYWFSDHFYRVVDAVPPTSGTHNSYEW